MGFLQNRLSEAKDAVAAGQTGRAAEILMHALIEGPGTFDENLTNIVKDKDPKQ